MSLPRSRFVELIWQVAAIQHTWVQIQQVRFTIKLSDEKIIVHRNGLASAGTHLSMTEKKLY